MGADDPTISTAACCAMECGSPTETSSVINPANTAPMQYASKRSPIPRSTNVVVDARAPESSTGTFL